MERNKSPSKDGAFKRLQIMRRKIMASPIPELQGSNSYCYIKTLNLNNRAIHSYLLKNTEQNTIQCAKAAITSLLQKPTLYIATFDQQLSDDQIKNNPYLTINGKAICLSEQGHYTKQKFADMFFSCALLKEPIRCSQNHILEKERAEFWSQNNGGNCPRGNHAIDKIEVDEDFQDEITVYLDKHNDADDEIKACEFYNACSKMEIKQKEDNATKNAEIAKKNAIQTKKVTILAGEGTSKVVIKLAVPLLEKNLSEEIQKSIFKKFPVVSVAFGVVAGSYRYLYLGDTEGAVAEVASGVLACVPVYGTGLSFATDFLLLGRDLKIAYDKAQLVDSKLEKPIDLDVKEVLESLNLDPYKLITKAEFDEEFKKIIAVAHPDKEESSELGEERTIRAQQMLAYRDMIYKHYKWDGK
jgi:hypothetical protein